MYRRVLILQLGLCLATGCSGPSTPRMPQPGQPVFTVASYNINFGLAGDPITLKAIAAIDADLLLLQETTPEWEKHLRKRLGADYPYIGFRHCCRAGGLAVLSRFPLEDGAYVENPEGWFPAWRVVVASPLGPIQVLNVHLRPPVSDSGSWVSGYFNTDRFRLGEIDHFIAELQPDMPALVVGDFNEESGDAMQRLYDRGMRDAVSELAPSADTWRWPLPIGELSFTLDHLFYSCELVAVRAEVLKVGRSDHFPVRVLLQRSGHGGGSCPES